MSAFVVSKEHIDLLVRAALHAGRENFCWWEVDENGEYAGWRELDELSAEDRAQYQDEGDAKWRAFVSPSQLGQTLVSENVRSVHHRYPDDDPDMGELPGPLDAYYMGPYVYSDPGRDLTPGEVFRAIDCLDYQSCEHEDWRKSEAFAFLTALRKAYCDRIADLEEAPWEPSVA